MLGLQLGQLTKTPTSMLLHKKLLASHYAKAEIDTEQIVTFARDPVDKSEAEK